LLLSNTALAYAKHGDLILSGEINQALHHKDGLRSYICTVRRVKIDAINANLSLIWGNRWTWITPADGSAKSVEDVWAQSVRRGRWRFYSAAAWNYYTLVTLPEAAAAHGRWRYGFNVYCWLTVVCMRPRSFVARLVPLNCPRRLRSTTAICHLSPGVFLKTSTSAAAENLPASTLSALYTSAQM